MEDFNKKALLILTNLTKPRGWLVHYHQYKPKKIVKFFCTKKTKFLLIE